MAHTYSDGKHVWDVARLWELAATISAEDVSVASLLPQLDGPCWFESAPTAREVLDHCRRIMAADLAYPIILTPDGWVADGMHRLARAVLEGRASVSAVCLPVMPAPDAGVC